MLFNKLKVQVHLEEVSVFFPFLFVLDFCIGVKWIAEIGFHSLLQPPYVFDYVVRELLVMNVIKLVEIFLIFAHVGICILHSCNGKKGAKEEDSDCIFNRVLHIIIIGKKKVMLEDFASLNENLARCGRVH